MSHAAAAIAVALLIVRQCFVLGAIVRSGRFLASRSGRESADTTDLRFYLVVPVLREAQIVNPAATHFQRVLGERDGGVVLVTTAREAREANQHRSAGDTISAARHLVDRGILHMHYPVAEGVKADQLNYAAARLSAGLDDAALERTFVVIYDADSRPPVDSLEHFAAAIRRFPNAAVFHQSSRFRLPDDTQPLDGAALAIADAGALRANRFVLGYELPRLLNRLNARLRLKRFLCSYVYAHVTGHGLCVRLSHLSRLPFPALTALEDMQYSFMLGARNEAMVPIPSLDTAEVPLSVLEQVRQLSRWFLGPSRFLEYWRCSPSTNRLRTVLLGASAAGITLGWLSCAFLPLLLVVAAIALGGVTLLLVGVLTVIYAAQLLLVEQLMKPDLVLARRVGRLLAYPVSCTLFGFSGVLGMRFLLGAKSEVGKTERYAHGWNSKR